MKIGDKVRVTKCDACPKVVGKEAIIIKMDIVGEVVVKFGRGRPQKNRPDTYTVDNVCPLEEMVSEIVE